MIAQQTFRPYPSSSPVAVQAEGGNEVNGDTDGVHTGK